MDMDILSLSFEQFCFAFWRDLQYTYVSLSYSAFLSQSWKFSLQEMSFCVRIWDYNLEGG